MEGNVGLTSSLLSSLKRNDNRSPVMLSSSIQAVLDNPYGMSKRACEDILFAYAKETGAKVLVYRFPNIFGKWCRPNYNSVIATFCHNLANGLPIQINNPNIELNLVYIDDVIAELIQALSGMENRSGDLCLIPIVYKARLGAVAELIQSFIDCRNNLSVPDLGDSFTKKLYSTYLSYLPEDRFKYPLNMHIDERGSFTEFIRTPERGQFSINISRPGIVKGQHWHHTKNEKFLVVCGKGLVRFRKINSDIVLEYHVSGDNLEVIDIPVGYTHSIINIGDCNLVALVWANEPFDPEHPDTYPLNV
jgi:UDP-2-acetamido-2,6-beta-L-arabino-hexul-4-ose reductase